MVINPLKGRALSPCFTHSHGHGLENLVYPMFSYDLTSINWDINAINHHESPHIAINHSESLQTIIKVMNRSRSLKFTILHYINHYNSPYITTNHYMNWQLQGPVRPPKTTSWAFWESMQAPRSPWRSVFCQSRGWELLDDDHCNVNNNSKN